MEYPDQEEPDEQEEERLAFLRRATDRGDRLWPFDARQLRNANTYALLDLHECSRQLPCEVEG